jgi:nucleoside-diphosphate-sugar epimerase
MILLTGVSGFIGKHLLETLLEKYGDKNVLCLTSKPINSCKYLIHNNYQFSPDLFTSNGYNEIETIIHAGAFTPKNSNQADNIELSNSNILNTVKLINAEFPKLQNVIFLSTLDVYDASELITESTIEKPKTLYGHSKLYCEKLIQSWGIQNKKNVQILRVGHVYGPGEEAYVKIIPVAIKNILAKKNIEIWGTGEELRSFIYIKDVVKAIVNAIVLKAEVGVINIVGGHSISINEIVNKIIELSSSKTEVIKINSDKPGRNLVFDTTKMNKYLLQDETPMEIGLLEEFNYFKNLEF